LVIIKGLLKMIKKLFINLFTTLFISGAVLSFLLATESPMRPTQAEKYILFEHCKPYYDMSGIPKTLDEFGDLKNHEHIQLDDSNMRLIDMFFVRIFNIVNDPDLGIQTGILQRAILRTDMRRSKKNSIIIKLPNLPRYSYGYYKDKSLYIFQINIKDVDFPPFYCKYDNNGKLIELTYDRGNGMADYNYKGRFLDSISDR